MRNIKRNMLMQFSVVSFLVLTAIAIILVVFLSGSLKEKALGDVINHVKTDTAIVIDKYLKRIDLNTPMVGEQFEQFDEIVQRFLISELVALVKVWGTDGTLIYTSDPLDVGEIPTDEPHFIIAMSGTTSAHIHYADQANGTTAVREHDLLEVYSPIVFPGDTSVYGVLAIYQYYEPTAHHISDMQQQVFWATGVGFLLLYGSLISIVWHGSRTINRQQIIITNANDELNTLNPALQKSHDNLERRVSERTLELSKTNETLKSKEVALRISEGTTLALLNAPSDALILQHINGTILAANAEAAKRAGLSVDELVGKDIYTLFLDDVAQARRARVDEVIRLREPIYFEDERDGRTFEDSVYPILDAQGEVKRVALVGRDITERKQAEEERIRYAKLESVGILAGSIAHDFNNLLTGIIGNIGLAIRYIEPKSKAEETLLEAEKASLRARDLTQQLLTFSAGGTPLKNIVHIVELIKESVDFVLRGSNVRSDFDLPDNLWPVEADEGQINQAITNLVINADQAMPDGGILNIRAKNMVIKRRGALPLPKGNYIEITIEDHGIGIPYEHLDKIFDLYFTTKQKGSGLGLATTYSILKKHDGHITVESTQNVGTTFHIYLPVSKEQVPVEKKAIAEAPVPGEGKILVMDDEAMIRQLLHRELTEVGYEVELSSDGAEAIKLYKRAKESGQPFDAVILDLTIPGGMGGKDTIKRLLEIDPSVKAIVSSGYSSDLVISRYRQYGFSGVLSKPYALGELAKAIDKVLQGKKK